MMRDHLCGLWLRLWDSCKLSRGASFRKMFLFFFIFFFLNGHDDVNYVLWFNQPPPVLNQYRSETGIQSSTGLSRSLWLLWNLTQQPFGSAEPSSLHFFIYLFFSLFFIAAVFLVFCLVRFSLFLLPRASVTTL